MALKLRELNRALHVGTRIGVGSVRSRRPDYVSLMPPCNHACPAGENIQGWLALAQSGAYEAAWHLLKTENPFPAIHGRACYHPCESSCNRAEMDDAVAIHEVERFLGDMAAEKNWRVACKPATGKKVLVVGSGPAGLSCAYHLARQGHQVEIREASAHAGGMLAYGIPAYRLPMDILEREMDDVLSMPGVSLHCNAPVTDLAQTMKEGAFDAVFLGVGAARALTMPLATEAGYQPVEAIDLLHAVREGKRPELGRTVVVVGGGNVAMDAARTARRLGAEKVFMVYRRDEAHMSALPEEREAAEAEGVTIRYCSVVTHYGHDGVEIEHVELDPQTGAICPPADGHAPDRELLAADSVILAIGQHSDFSLCSDMSDIVIDKGERLEIDPSFMTGARGVFAGGDCVRGARTMTTATGHGKKAARAIDAYLRAEKPVPDAPAEIVTFDMLHMPALLMAVREEGAELPTSLRTGFEEIIAGLNETQARHEAGRCLSCGNCFECDNCFAACSEQAIIRLGPGRGYAVDETLCTGCGDCAGQCPCHAIVMTPEHNDAECAEAAVTLTPQRFVVRA
ncbi:NAD(P)-binding protein [Asaia bogorensis]|uniref:NAD(P)-binding protein n=1 Tax=Asaia bogorensis TaxID=91915 RepID=UPI00285B7BAE|nr:NAD(P)-binding protein [Asaia bogorensis]MDR6183011.1 formate dehydrogenase beta subunit [Asaia bogorensis NBRC 16594]